MSSGRGTVSPRSAGRERSFEGQVAIITGGASGIGRALGSVLHRNGGHVVLADIDVDAANHGARAIAAATPDGSGSVVGQSLDVRDADAVRSLVETVASTHGHLDLMFNNAGISIGGPTQDQQRVHWDRIIDVNLNGVVNGVLAAYPLMIEQGSGHIVNTASGAGLAPMVLTAAYTATKHAVVGLSTALRPEAAAHGVRVSVLCPGAVDTPILDRRSPADLPSLPASSLSGRAFLARFRVPLMDVDRFAPLALRGVARNQSIIVVPASAKALWYLHRLSPGATERIGRLMARRATGPAPEATR